jgi:hypothetical protein
MSDKTIDRPTDNIDAQVRHSIASNNPRSTRETFEDEKDKDLLRIDNNEDESSFSSRRSAPFQENSKADQAMSN